MRTRAVAILFVGCLSIGIHGIQGDPFLWLEEVEGERALAWVEARNAETLAALGEGDEFQTLYRDVLDILTAQDRIAYPSTVGDVVYNFWTDSDHPRGIYRRTSLSDYLGGNPEWETVLDIDALAAREDVPWAFRGMTCLAPEHHHCMVNLSRGGSDATEIREFDLPSAAFAENGFFVPEAKNSIAWVDASTLLVGTDFGVGSMTTSGYARTIRRWPRGVSLSEAETVFEIDETDMGAFTSSLETREGSLAIVSHRREFYDGFT